MTGKMTDFDHLLQMLSGQFLLARDSMHGPRHWRRVERFGLYLLEQRKAPPDDLDLVRLFALFHDCCRENESWDPDHGARGARMAETLRGKHFDLPDERFERLQYACTHHTSGWVSSDPVVGACWDADRLDLMRFNVMPNRKLLSTAAAKDPKTVDWARKIVLEDRARR
ncbi:MAG: HD domain-containing protein [Planctomycetota bacterium]|nr:HD domain-containing protein [Planctomycetota bacterium]